MAAQGLRHQPGQERTREAPDRVTGVDGSRPGQGTRGSSPRMGTRGQREASGLWQGARGSGAPGEERSQDLGRTSLPALAPKLMQPLCGFLWQLPHITTHVAKPHTSRLQLRRVHVPHRLKPRCRQGSCWGFPGGSVSLPFPAPRILGCGPSLLPQSQQWRESSSRHFSLTLCLHPRPLSRTRDDSGPPGEPRTVSPHLSRPICNFSSLCHVTLLTTAPRIGTRTSWRPLFC